MTKLRYYTDLWLATGRCNGVEMPATRRPTVAINQIVDRVVTANKVLPVALKDGYSMAIRAERQPPGLDWQSKNAQAKPHSSLDQAQYASEIEYLREAYKEKLAELSTINEKSALEVDTTKNDDLHADDLLANTAAERIFVEMLISDWRLKIARCVSPACSTYFRLKKWNQPYEKGTRCPACRHLQEKKDKQDRVEDNRETASRRLWSFTANRFSQRISRNAAWFRDAAFKSDIIEAINVHIEGDKLLKTIYPKPITTKWLVRANNRNAITRRVTAERRADAKR